ncbi:serine/threonine-protein kinase [Streptomyces sp. NPDC020412]|uniref:serine/threonine-protein kinase n=1 Tax=Streptomyces sp. NPDC020412 TaxID=3365073 RepID=UPI00379947A5
MSATNEHAQRIIADRYLLGARIGRGGMGTVWRGTDRLLRRTVAVKEVSLQSTGEEGAVRQRRAVREARAIAQISHNNVVDIHDLVQEDDRLWLVMELVDGPSLAEHVAAAGPVTPARAAEIGLQVAAALDAVHAVGVLHRDVKPANILLRADGSAVLCDFGIAALAGTESLTASGGVVGSLPFLAPERLKDGPVGPASDLFSLGCTLCALLTGRSPFTRPEAVGVMHAVAHERPELPPNAGPLRNLLGALLHKDPAQRPSSAEVAHALRAVAADGAGRTAVEPLRRRPALRRVALPAALLLVAAGIVGVLVDRFGDDDSSSGAQDAKPSAGTRASKSAPPVSSGPPTRVDAALTYPSNPATGGPAIRWLFSDDDHVEIDKPGKDGPFSGNLTEVLPTVDYWVAFENLPGFRDRIDAVLPVPKLKDEYWVFSGAEYVRIRIDAELNDELLEGPKPLKDWSKAFGGQDDFLDGIDSVMPTPDDPSQFWVFAGDRYIRAELNKSEAGGELVQGPSSLGEWQTFAEHEDFSGKINAVVDIPDETNEYWVLSEARYMRIRVANDNDRYADTVVEPPKPLPNWDNLG